MVKLSFSAGSLYIFGLIPYILFFAQFGAFLWAINVQGQSTGDRSFDYCVDPLFHMCFYEQGSSTAIGFPNIGPRSENEPRPRDLDKINTGGKNIVCQIDGTCGREDIPNRDTCCANCKSCTYENCCNCAYTNVDKYCPIPGYRAPDYRATAPDRYVACNRDGTCSDTALAPGVETCCGNCMSCTFKDCCHCSFTNPDQYCQIDGGFRNQAYTGKNRQFVNCKSDGNCALEDHPNLDTTCFNCQSCTFQGCCHVSFTDPAKHCPIPGWRSPDYSGDGIVPRASNDPGRCGNPTELAVQILNHANYLYAIYLFTFRNPYRWVAWYQIVPMNPNRVVPDTADEGRVLMRLIEGRGDGAERPEMMHRNIRPQDVHQRTGGFTSTQRLERFNILGGDFETDQAGHILANTLGGPDNALFNFFPQHASVNANRGSRWLLDSWVDAEYRMRYFLSYADVPLPGQPNDRMVQFRVFLIYNNEREGRPTEITWAVVFYNGGQVVYSMGGRVYNSGRDGNGVQATCPRQ